MREQVETRRPHGSLGALAMCMALGLTACASHAVRAPNASVAATAAADSVPAALRDAGERGEGVYDSANVHNWNSAGMELALLKEAVSKVRANLANQRETRERLRAHVATLERAVAAKDRLAAMREANHVTLDVAEMTAAHKPTVPVAVTKLDYDGRELRIWSEANDANQLQATARAIRQEWDALRPMVAARDAAEANAFDALVAQVERAQTPAESARLATAMLDEVDKLEQVFVR